MGKRQFLTKETIINKAIEIADERGINELSMRKLAGELGIQAMSLYHHFETKDRLLSEMMDKLLSNIELLAVQTDQQDWRSILLSRSISAKLLFSKHPWLPLIIDSHIVGGSKRLEYLNSYIGILRKAGMPIEIALKAISLLDCYLYGFCRQLSHSSSQDASSQELAEAFADTFESVDYPYLSEATSLALKAGYDEEADFLFGMRLILDAIAREIDAMAQDIK